MSCDQTKAANQTTIHPETPPTTKKKNQPFITKAFNRSTHHHLCYLLRNAVIITRCIFYVCACMNPGVPTLPPSLFTIVWGFPFPFPLPFFLFFYFYFLSPGKIGVQHTDNAILEKISRGHGVEATIDALRLLKDNCFKVLSVFIILPNKEICSRCVVTPQVGGDVSTY